MIKLKYRIIFEDEYIVNPLDYNIPKGKEKIEVGDIIAQEYEIAEDDWYSFMGNFSPPSIEIIEVEGNNEEMEIIQIEEEISKNMGYINDK